MTTSAPTLLASSDAADWIERWDRQQTLYLPERERDASVCRIAPIGP